MARDDNHDDDVNDHETVSAMAERLGLTGDDKEKYIHRHMTGLGYKTQRSYVKDDDNDDDDDDGLVPGRRRHSGGSSGRSGGRNRRARDDDWY